MTTDAAAAAIVTMVNIFVAAVAVAVAVAAVFCRLFYTYKRISKQMCAVCVEERKSNILYWCE